MNPTSEHLHIRASVILTTAVWLTMSRRNTVIAAPVLVTLLVLTQPLSI